MTETRPDLQRFTLERVPADASLQAWNAADELLLERLPDSATAVLLLNDAFGALAIALGDRLLGWWNDSAMATQGLRINCAVNQVSPPRQLTFPDDLPEQLDCVVLVAPKSVDFFAWQLSQLAPRLARGGRIYVPGMVKHLSEGHQKAMRDWFDHVNPGRAVKKARCVELCSPRDAAKVPASRYQTPQGLTLINAPGCFSAQRPDPGALAFLELFDQLPGADRVLDLGCGNGILGLSYLQRHPASRAILIDESAQAIASTQASAEANGLTARVEGIHNNGLTSLALSDLPLVLCNPPFHQANSLTDAIADQLMADAARALATDGELWLVGNRHLGYHQRLKRHFRTVEVRSAHPKFVVLAAREPKA